jgi:integrase
MTSRHSLLDNKVQLYMRPNSPVWQSACSIAGKQRRTSTKEESLARAKDVARDWYLGLMGKYQAGELREGVPFRQAAETFVSEYEAITLGERNKEYAESHAMRLRVHLLPFIGDRLVTDVKPGLVQQYRVHRMTSRRDKNGVPKRPSRTTMHSEMVTLRLVLKTANRHGWIDYLPDLSSPYGTSGKISHRAWFAPDEYKQFYEASRERAKHPKSERWRLPNEDLHDFILFMVNSGLRPDEAKRIQVRDIEAIADGANDERILHIAVRGKRGVGYCKTMPGAVLPFERMVKRHGLEPSQLLFPKIPRELFNELLVELGMKQDREGNPRTSYSLRHTYICLRLMEGVDIYQIAKNCRTSVEMIEKYYASHIKNMLDATAINVRRVR